MNTRTINQALRPINARIRQLQRRVDRWDNLHYYNIETSADRQELKSLTVIRSQVERNLREAS